MKRNLSKRRLVLLAMAMVVAAGDVAVARDVPRDKKPARSAKKAVDKPVFTVTPYKVEQVIPPSVLHGVQGLAFGPDGTLYAGSLLGRSISKVDTASGALSGRSCFRIASLRTGCRGTITSR